MTPDLGRVTGDGETDGPPPGADAWKAETKAIERVISIALTLDRPQTADWIADEAAVSPQTARDHLSSLSELTGIIAETTVSGVTKYQIDSAYERFREVSEIVERYEKDEIMDLVSETKSQIEEVEERFGVADPDGLREKATESEASASDVEEYKKVASEWETLEYRLDLVEEALERYDEFCRPEVRA